MLESFEANLSQFQKEEMVNLKVYEDLKVVKEAEIAAGQALKLLTTKKIWIRQLLSGRSNLQSSMQKRKVCWNLSLH